MSFAHIQADSILASVSWTQDDSLENLIFEWLKLQHAHSCRKKKDFVQLLELFRDHHFNKFVHNNTGRSCKFVTLICESKPTSKQDYEDLFSKMSAYKSVLEPMPGGHADGVPLLLLWPSPRLNKIWYKDEVGHKKGVCCRCAGTRNVTFIVRQEPECPANSVWLCANCSPPVVNVHAPYALPLATKQAQMLKDMTTLYTDFLSEQSYETAWARHYAAHNSTFQAVVTDFNTSLVQSRLELTRTQQELHHVQDKYVNLQRWADNHMYSLPQQLQQAYSEGQHSCKGYDLR